MSTIAERLSEVDTKLNNILANANTQLTNKGKTAVSDLSDLPSALGELKNPTGTISITENGTVDVSQYANANVNVAGSGGKNTQAIIGLYVTTKSAYKPSGLKLTVGKTGTYTIKWVCQRMSTSGTNGTALYINNTQYGNNFEETWGITYYKDNTQNPTTAPEWAYNEVNNVSLSENDVVQIYSRSNNNTNWLYNYSLVIEEE